ncbi:MAG: TonB-dependent receptor [Balneola sp.]|nr:MAG: TonB-dependent receptor [Balneola sp.]
MTSALFIVTLLVSLSGTPLDSLESSFIISGTITDAQDRESVSFSYIHLEELNRTTTSNSEGYFELKNIPAGNYTLSIHRIGYKTQKRKIELEKNISLDIVLSATILTSETVEVISSDNSLTGSSIGHASKSVSGSSLRRDLGSTLANTLSNLPGFEQRSLGNATTRPVIRGLGDERLIILQDGLTTGDVSDQSADHAVSVDPIASSEIEIAKGAAALQYGANAVGGIVNVVNNLVASTKPNTINGTATLNAQSVNTSASGAINLSLPTSDFVINTHLNGKIGGDTNTPEGIIENTQFETTNSAVGISYVRDWGYIGGSFGTYLSNYGIPPDPNGHPDGVDIEMRKFNYALKGEYLIENSVFKTIEADFSINNYNHKEFETTSSIGTEFGLVTTTAQVNANHGELGFFESGKIGLWAEAEDYAVFGASTPDANSYKIGVYIIENMHLGALHLETGVRYDYVLNEPIEDDPDSDIGFIRARDFHALSSSVNAWYDLGKGFSVGTVLLHSFRAPSLEELYSEGPHLASFSFEIGNPNLDPERSLAKEVFTQWQGEASTFRAALFHNGFSNFNYARNTGEQNVRFPTLDNYQFVGTKARLYGFEIAGESKITNRIVADASASFTIGEQDTTSLTGDSGVQPLPQIPPLKVKFSLKYVKGGLEAGSRLVLASNQDRTGEFETETDGYVLTNLFSQYRFSSNKLLHTFSLGINNLFDVEYRNHLSRIKELNPEPGRNITFLYRVYF